MKERLYRSGSDAMLGGVAAGLAHYFGLDPTIIRLVWLVLAVISPEPAIVIYIIGWIVIPSAPEGGATSTFARGEQLREQVIESAKEFESRVRGSSRGAYGDGEGDRRRTLGWILIAAGILLLFRNMLPWFDIARMWPLLLVIGGAVLIVQAMRK